LIRGEGVIPKKSEGRDEELPWLENLRHPPSPRLLPSAARLGVSNRTVQRRLKEEGMTFQWVLNRTREDLATHYLKTSRMSGAEISFLLGFEDPNSFSRAFQAWTGNTPEHVRAAARMGE
jgi:AraC-like DNA-binding protein